MLQNYSGFTNNDYESSSYISLLDEKMRFILKHISDCFRRAFLFALGHDVPKPTDVFLDIFDVVAVA